MRLSQLDPWLSPRRLALLAALAGAGTILSVLATWALSHGLILPNKRIVGGDYLAFWSAGTLALEGRAAEAHAAASLHEIHQRVAPGLSVLYLWHHPPPFLLVATTFATLPYLWSIAAWLALSGALYAAATRALAPNRLALVFAFAAPAAATHLGNAQLGLIAAAAFAFALVWLPRRPLAAGAMIGLLAIKPHLAALFPLALAAQGRWRAFAAAAATALGLCGAAALAFGPNAYVGFFENLTNAESVVTQERVPAYTAVSLYGNLIGLGAPALAAGLAHAASALAAAGLVVLVWRRGARDAAGAALAAGSALISPYLFFYDLTLLLVACALISRDGGWDRLSRLEKLTLILGWSAPALALSFGQIVTLPIGPAASWGLLLIAARQAGLFTRGESAAADPAPAQQR